MSQNRRVPPVNRKRDRERRDRSIFRVDNAVTKPPWSLIVDQRPYPSRHSYCLILAIILCYESLSS